MHLLVVITLLALSRGGIISITLLTPQNQTIPVYTNNTLNSTFSTQEDPFSCSMPPIFQYSQTPAQLQSNANYSLVIRSSTISKISVTTKYNNFQPTLSAYSCILNCTIIVSNNCPLSISKSDYFDQIYVNINDIIFSYLVDCDDDFTPHIFEWGLFVIIIFITLLITVGSVYSRAWSIGGFGMKLGYVFLAVYASIFLAGGIISVFYTQVVDYVVDGLCWVLGFISVSLCFNQMVYPLKIKWLLKPLIGVIRLLDLISCLIGLGMTFGWWFSSKNWILNDIIAICICVAFIKLFKFISLKTAFVYMVVIVSVQMGIALCIYYIMGISYNFTILNSFNNPLQIQLPSINKIMGLRCSWIPITEVVFPGVFLSYTRRFDDSRNTHMYLIISCLTFFSASIGWMLVTILNFHSLPLDVFTQPSLMLVVILFATKRNQIRTVWDGKFYDVQFLNKADIELVQNEIVRQSHAISFNETLMKGLKVDDYSIRQSELTMKRSLMPKDAL